MIRFLSMIMLFLIFISTISMNASAQQSSVNHRVYAFRIKPHEDLKKSIQQFATTHRIKAGAIVTCVGSLEQFYLRFANQQTGVKEVGHFEILSLSGTFSESAMHLHLSVADSTGKTIGGHLLEENLIYTTAEVVVIEMADLEFHREVDSTYGYPELLIRKIEKKKL